MNVFIHLFTNYLLKINYVPENILGTRNMSDTFLSLGSLDFGSRRQIINKQVNYIRCWNSSSQLEAILPPPPKGTSNNVWRLCHCQEWGGASGWDRSQGGYCTAHRAQGSPTYKGLSSTRCQECPDLEGVNILGWSGLGQPH